MLSELSSHQSGCSIVHLECRFADQIVAMHMDVLGEDVLPALGREFLLQYYRYAFLHESQILIGAVVNDELVGFCQLSILPVGVFNILTECPLLVFDVIKLAILSPWMVCRGLLLALDRSREDSAIPEVSFIAVKQDMQSMGLGKAMIAELNRLAASRGFSAISTKTTNVAAQGMYEKYFGARLKRKRIVLGRTYRYLFWATGKPLP